MARRRGGNHYRTLWRRKKKLRIEYERKPNNFQKASHQKSTGNYILEQLPYHNGMHTIADFISNVMDMLVGKCNAEKVKLCGIAFQSFGEIWDGNITEEPVEPSKKKKKNLQTPNLQFLGHEDHRCLQKQILVKLMKDLLTWNIATIKKLSQDHISQSHGHYERWMQSCRLVKFILMQKSHHL